MHKICALTFILKHKTTHYVWHSQRHYLIYKVLNPRFCACNTSVSTHARDRRFFPSKEIVLLLHNEAVVHVYWDSCGHVVTASLFLLLLLLLFTAVVLLLQTKGKKTPVTAATLALLRRMIYVSTLRCCPPLSFCPFVPLTHPLAAVNMPYPRSGSSSLRVMINYMFLFNKNCNFKYKFYILNLNTNKLLQSRISLVINHASCFDIRTAGNMSIHNTPVIVN